MPTRRDCFCEGSNANCRYCSGTGVRNVVVVGERAQAGRPGRPAQPTPTAIGWLPAPEPKTPRRIDGKASARGTFPPVSRPVRQQKARQKGRRHHPNQLHGRGVEAVPRAMAERSGPISTMGSGPAIPNSRVSIPPGFAPCPECRYPIRITLLTQHLKLAHGGGSRHVAPIRPQEAKKTDGPRVKHHDVENPAGERIEERRLDATRDYAPIREFGRFGSHSSHDDFGDDSAP
jgi:hypothetical protein